MNLVARQFVFANQADTFDANLNAASEYCASLDSNSVTQESTVAPLINALASTLNGANESNAQISLSVTPSDISSNCITYGDVVFVPAIASDDNQQNQLANTIELIKDEQTAAAPQNDVNQTPSFKCVLSSDAPFVDTFLQAPNDNLSTVLCETSTLHTFTEQHETHPTHLATLNTNINGTNDLVANDIPTVANPIGQQQMYQIVDPNHVNIQMPASAAQEVLIQDEHGQIYRSVQNIYGTPICSNELLPIISTQIDIAPNAAFDEDQVHLQPLQNVYHHPDHHQNNEPYEMPVNFISTSNSNERTSHTIDATDLQEVQFLFDTYRNGGQINDIHQTNAVESNQFQIETNTAATNYQTQFEMQSNKEQNLLDSTMSTLCECFLFSFLFFECCVRKFQIIILFHFFFYFCSGCCK